MSFLLRHIARYAAQKLASDPRVREKAAKAARVVVVVEARHIARIQLTVAYFEAGRPNQKSLG